METRDLNSPELQGTTMKRYHVMKSTAVFYSATVIANSKEEAEQILMAADQDHCFAEETMPTLCEYDTEELDDDEENDLPILRQTKEGYEPQ
jgi:hypothetical protein